MNDEVPMRHTTGRREFLTLLGACAGAGLAPRGGSAQRALPARAIPSSGESLPIVGLGSTRPVTEIGVLGAERVESIVRALVEHGGKVVDTWPRNVDNDSAFGRIIGNSDLRDRLFVTINLDAAGVQAGSDQFERTLRAYQRDSIDLVNVGSLIDLDARWPSLKRWKEEGRARYVGVTAAQAALYPQLESFLEKEAPDFVEINYSVTERDAERRLLPLLADRGIAALVSRPFMNGAYFDRLANEPLPAWTAELECGSWAQFSLQYIFANPAVTCVLTETTDPAHMAENALAALKPAPDAAARERMRGFIDAI
jgi:diketogulonate reductase-like aldo/keto reductase